MSLGARMVALDVLLDVHQQGAYASLALNERLKSNRALAARDKRLVTELVYGTLENQIRLDYMIDHFLERKDAEILVRDVLRLGAYQLFFLDRVPNSAAVDESVKLTRAKDREPYTGLVNAVLRNMIREPGRTKYPDANEQPAKYLSVMHSLPEWLAQRLIDAYGLPLATEIAAYRQPDSFVTVRPNLERTTEEAFQQYLARRHYNATPGIAPHAVRITQPGDLAAEREFAQGQFSIQGESSMLAAYALGAQPGWTILDACAAPGGKTALIAEQLRGSGRVQSWDVHAHRVELIRSVVQRMKLDNVRPIERDASVHREELDGTFDAVLIDAPCSGLGVMLNKPDVKYRQTPEGVADLVALQQRILDACGRYVKPGGVLVYSTCSILPEENCDQVAAFLATHPDFTLDSLSPYLPDALKDQAEGGQVQFYAHRDGVDGFYIARMRRAKG